MHDIPFSAASERNKAPILAVLKSRILPGQSVLEIGTGTGQHAVFFAANLEGVRWLPTDMPESVALSVDRIAQSGLSNLDLTLPLNVSAPDWGVAEADAVFSANTAHIMSWSEVEHMFRGVGNLLQTGRFYLYGPFNRAGKFTSEGNAAFHRSLQARDSRMGIRDDEALIALGKECGMELLEDLEMPSNNRLLVWG